MVYLLVALLVVIVVLVARAQLNVWGVQPVVYSNLPLDEVAPYVRSWAAWLAERGRIVVRHSSTEAEVELRKQRFATQPDRVLLRVRNADGSKRHFETIKRALDQDHVSYELETTPKTQKPRAIRIALVAEDIHTPAATLSLLQQIFGAVDAGSTGFAVHAEGRMRQLPDAPHVPLVAWRRDFQAGRRIGAAAGRVVKRLFG